MHPAPSRRPAPQPAPTPEHQHRPPIQYPLCYLRPLHEPKIHRHVTPRNRHGTEQHLHNRRLPLSVFQPTVFQWLFTLIPDQFSSNDYLVAIFIGIQQEFVHRSVECGWEEGPVNVYFTLLIMIENRNIFKLHGDAVPVIEFGCSFSFQPSSHLVSVLVFKIHPCINTNTHTTLCNHTYLPATPLIHTIYTLILSFPDPPPQSPSDH